MSNITGFKAVRLDAEGNETEFTEHAKCMYTGDMQFAQEWLSRQPQGSFIKYRTLNMKDNQQ